MEAKNILDSKESYLLALKETKGQRLYKTLLFFEDSTCFLQHSWQSQDYFVLCTTSLKKARRNIDQVLNLTIENSLVNQFSVKTNWSFKSIYLHQKGLLFLSNKKI